MKTFDHTRPADLANRPVADVTNEYFSTRQAVKQLIEKADHDEKKRFEKLRRTFPNE